ncbi:hypothetical protein BN946_scf184790.g13 [Trametes cinnabarina]|uniref:Uncharacterized protein n=1 Tax=Pycnoporus cinnabarinus TaxID=5643 RepID=A0A060S8Q2_PYCCI|nr:hypothetical protein BN946_scf184790.g13 [Trametes cinnabarina]
MSPENQKSIEADKPEPRRPHIILFTLPSLSFSTPLQSVNAQITLRTISSDKLFRMADRSFSTRATLGAPNPDQSSASSGSSRERALLMHEFAQTQLDVMAVKQDVRELKPKMVNLESRLTALETKVDRLEIKVDQLEIKVDRLEIKVDQLETHVELIDRKLDQVLQMLGGGPGRRGGSGGGTGGIANFRQYLRDLAVNILHRANHEDDTRADAAIEERGGHTHRQAAAGPSRPRGPQSRIGQPILPGHR